LRLEQVEQHGLNITSTACSTQRARSCPACGTASTSIHSRYQRTLADLPVQGLFLRFRLGVRRFYCRTRDCARQVFCERLDDLTHPDSRQTKRLSACLELIAQALGGNAGARLSQRLGRRASASMLLRRLRRSSVPKLTRPRGIGLDDWAYQKGQRYGTMVVDWEQQRVLDLLPDRTTSTAAAWLKTQPDIQVIGRDRASAYAEAARQGAPQAQQVTDRWPLLQNLTEAVQRVGERHYARWRQIIPPSTDEVESNHQRIQESLMASRPLSPAEQQRQERAERKQARCAEVLRLQAQGVPIQAIARQLRMPRRLVRQYIHLRAVPLRTPSPRRPCELDLYNGYLAQRWREGCHNAAQRWRELREQGFEGSCTRVRQWIGEHYRADRRRARGPTAPRMLTPSPRLTTWLLLKAPRSEKAPWRQPIHLFRQQVPEIDLVVGLAEEFTTLLHEKRSEHLSEWLDRASKSELSSFAAGLRRDWDAVHAAFSSPWSQGQVEGQINRLEMLKRQMYGRASFALLRSRVLFVADQPGATKSLAA
jgi:transposase